MTSRTTVKSGRVFANSVQRKSSIGTKFLGSLLIPISISVASFSVIVVVIDGAFGPTAIDSDRELVKMVCILTTIILDVYTIQ